MVELLPAGVLFFPISVVAATRRKWAITYLALTVPLFSVVAFEAISHSFVVPELAMFSLGINQLRRWTDAEQTTIRWSPSYTWFGAYLTVAACSVLYLLVAPADVLVNRYGIYPGEFRFVPLEFSIYNLTQFILRVFFVLSVVLIAENVRRSELPNIIRLLVIGGVVSGVFGVVYQLFALNNSQAFIEVLLWFGDAARPGGYGYLGPLPRMGSVTGEPGHIGQYLLYLFSVTTVLQIQDSTYIASKRTLDALVVILALFLLLTTSATAYGGFVIWFVLTTVVVIVAGEVSPFKLARIWTGALLLLVLGATLALTAFSGDTMSYLIEKLQFQAGSGALRMRYLVHGLEILPSRPFIGIGTGSHYSTNLLDTLLVENGIIGFAVFSVACLVAVLVTLRWTASGNGSPDGLILALSNGAIVLLVVSLLAKGIPTLLSPWFWFAVALPIASLRWMSGNHRSVPPDHSRER